MRLSNLFGIFGKKARRYAVLAALVASTATSCKAKIEPLYQEEERKADIARQVERQTAIEVKKRLQEAEETSRILEENKKIREKRMQEAEEAAEEETKKKTGEAEEQAKAAAAKAEEARKINAYIQELALTIQNLIQTIAKSTSATGTERKGQAAALHAALKEFTQKLDTLTAYGATPLEADLVKGFNGLKKFYDYYDYLTTYNYETLQHSTQPILPDRIDHPFQLKLLKENVANLQQTEQLLGITLIREREQLREAISYLIQQAKIILENLESNTTVRVKKEASKETLEIFLDKAPDIIDDL